VIDVRALFAISLLQAAVRHRIRRLHPRHARERAVVGSWGLSSILVLHAAQLALAAGMALVVPAFERPAPAQAMHALGPAAATAVLTLVSGHLCARLGGQAFLVMALLCVAATLLALMARARS